MRFLLALSIACMVGSATAQTYKKLPPPGIAIEESVRAQLMQRVATLRGAIRNVEVNSVEVNKERSGWLSDVEVLVRAVDLALDQNTFYKPAQVKQANDLLSKAESRLSQLSDAKQRLRWLGWDEALSDQNQLIVGGFRSSIDDSVQPFGIVLPKGFQPDGRSYRLDVWLHGRGDSKTEIPFLVERMTKVGQYAPKDTIVLHPFGRHCNAFKFAGEVDVLEAIEHISGLFSIDQDRVAIRGFSMGGAGCWHLAAHYTDRWFAANPGAGFVDTIVYQGWDRKAKPFPIDEVQQKLLHWYDVLPWVENLKNTHVVAYSGEIDKQKQAADRVIEAARPLGVSLEYVIGEKMGHKIDPPSATTIGTILDDWSSNTPKRPRQSVDWVTYSLRYPGAEWLRADGLAEHWTRATLSGELVGDDQVKITTDGVTHLNLDFSDSNAFEGATLKIEIDGDRFLVRDQTDGNGFFARLIRSKEGWFELQSEDQSLRKRAGLQGPIDDAFCDRFLFVIPSRPATHGTVQRWIARELDYARDRWKKLMRGDVREVLDTELTEEQIRNNHLICFGDFQSNQFLRKVGGRLPIQWSKSEIRVGESSFDPAKHAPVMCYPNPENPSRYVVINSGMTFREFSNVSNSRQIAMLPDWAVIDVRETDDAIYPGRVVDSGFFDEQWKLDR